MTAYKPHLACFHCRKVFKRRLLRDVQRDRPHSGAARCPQCGGLLADIGLDFAAPPNRDRTAWERLHLTYQVGFTFHSCGCSGPGYVPTQPAELVSVLRARKAEYVTQRRFWLTYQTPDTKGERLTERQQNWGFHGRLPTRKPPFTPAEAIAYWSERMATLDDRLARVESATRQARGRRTTSSVPKAFLQ